MKTKTEVLSLKIEPELKRRIEASAEKARLGLSEWMRLAALFKLAGFKNGAKK